MALILDGSLGITTPAETVTGNTILGDATTDTLNVGNGGLVKDASGNVGIGTATPLTKLDVVETATIKRVTSGNNMDLNFYNGSGAGVAGNVSRIRCDGDGVSNDYGALSFWTGQINSTPITERMRIDSSGNLLLGSTSATGNVSNTTQMVGGIFSTVNASGISALNATATTLFTLPNVSAGCWLISATLPGQSAVASYSVVAIVTTQATVASIATIKTATLATLSMSGLNVQITQSSGGTQPNCAYSAIRLF